jgi:hypothetical protein
MYIVIAAAIVWRTPIACAGLAGFAALVSPRARKFLRRTFWGDG